jgi:hypothetical protein
MMSHLRLRLATSAVVLLALLAPLTALASGNLNWRTNENRVTADIKSDSLFKVLEEIATVTRWQVFVEPETGHTVSAKFKDLPAGEALRRLLGDVNYALLPQSNGPARLYVFRTAQNNATRLVRPHDEADRRGHLIPNELIVRLKPGANVAELARALGAKVVGRLDKFNAYRLRFEDQTAADAAREQLVNNPDVAAVDNNYTLDRPTNPQDPSVTSVPPVQLKLNPPPSNGRVIVGLVDTAVQSLGGNLDSFLLKPISVAGDANLDPNMPSHGTSMAETILRSLEAATKGSTSVQIQPVDVYGPNPTTSTFDVANGIAAAVNAGANVINLSLGSDADSPFLHGLIQQVRAQNIPIFAAAGNDPVTTPYFPAAYPEVMAVTAVDQGTIAPYANRGSFVSLGAPGTSLVYYNSQAYYVVGTSAASAFTSGIAAGYLDSTHGSVDKMQAFIRANFGLKPSAGP